MFGDDRIEKTTKVDGCKVLIVKLILSVFNIDRYFLTKINQTGAMWLKFMSYEMYFVIIQNSRQNHKSGQY